MQGGRRPDPQDPSQDPPKAPSAPEGAQGGARQTSWRDVSLANYRRYTRASSIIGVLVLAWGFLRLVQAHVISGLLLVVIGFVTGLWTLALRIDGTPAVYHERAQGKRPAPETDKEQWRPRVLHFYTRRGCTLCDEARARLDPVLEEKGITLVAHDVDKDPVLLERYGARVPVAVYDGEELFALQYDDEAVRVVR